jgi:hypothetical protein
MDKRRHPPKALLITADTEGSMARARACKLELLHFADRAGLTIRVSHFPPGTSKWNKNRARTLATSNWPVAP